MLSPPMARGNRCSTVNDDAMGWYCFTEGGLDIVIILSHVGHLLPMFLLSSVLSVFGIEDGKAVIVFGGGCQGCGMADVTLKQGVETMIKDHVPSISEVIDAIHLIQSLNG